MRLSKKFPSPARAVICFSLALSACMTKDDPSSVSGTIDPAAMSATLNASATYLNGWEQNLSASLDSLPSTSTSLAKVTALAKTAAAGDTIISIDSLTKASGYVTVIRIIPGPLGLQITYDTVRVRYDANYKDTVKNNENLMWVSQTVAWQFAGKPTGAFDRTVFSDVDGDSIIYSAARKDTNRVKIVFTKSFTFFGQPWLSTATLEVGPGLDNNFDLDADNVVYQASWNQTWAGLANSFYFKNRQGGDEITPNDTMHLFLSKSSTIASDTLSSLQADIAFNPGVSLNNPNDDLFYSLRVTSHKRIVFERDGEFTFIPSKPVPHGQQPDSGSFSAKITFANDKSASLAGTFSPTGYQATYTGPEDLTKSVQYSKTGTVVAGN